MTKLKKSRLELVLDTLSDDLTRTIDRIKEIRHLEKCSCPCHDNYIPSKELPREKTFCPGCGQHC